MSNYEDFPQGKENVTSKIDSTIRKEIVDALQEALIKYGYERQYATMVSESLVGSSLDFYATGNFFTDTKIDKNSRLGNVISNTDFAKLYGNAMTFNTYYQDVLETIKAVKNLSNVYDGEGELSPEARKELKKLTNHFINGVSSYVGGIPMIGVGYNTAFDFLNQKFDKVFDWANNKANAGTLYEILGTDLSYNGNYGFIPIYEGLMAGGLDGLITDGTMEGYWKQSLDLVSWQDINQFYNDNPNKASCLDSYVEWRLQQEYKQRIENYCAEKGITYEKYLEDLKYKQIAFENELYSIWQEENPDKDKKWGILSRWYFDTFVKDKYVPGEENDDNDINNIFSRIDATGMSDSEKSRIKEIIKRDIENSAKCIEYGDNENVKKILRGAKSAVATARATRYDPLILDLDGDGYNIEKKELGANFDLDKNGFAEKINWTSRYNLKRKRVFDMIS